MEVSAVDLSGKMASVPAALNGPRPVAVVAREEQGADGDRAPVSQAQLVEMVEQMQSHLDSMNVSLRYSFYGDGGEKIAVKVVNKETGEIIREIPSREMQILQSKMSELVGMIFNDNA